MVVFCGQAVVDRWNRVLYLIYMTDLLSKKCKPCESTVAPLSINDAQVFVNQLHSDWQLIEGKKIKREFEFKNFIQAIAFVNMVADIAEIEGHHPDLHIFYKKVIVELWTHSIGGLSENDFIVAAKIDATQ